MSTALILNEYCPVGRMPVMTVAVVASGVADCIQKMSLNAWL